MNSCLRIVLFVVAMFVIKLSGRAFMLAVIAETGSSSLLSATVMLVFFLVGAVGLFAAFGERYFSDVWLISPAIAGLWALTLSAWTTSCANVLVTDVTYDAYYCSHPEAKWLMGVLCFALILMVLLRKLAVRSASQ